jgi:hypothetical protein
VPLWTPQTKPAPGCSINWGHSLARGLVGCWLLNEGSGIRATNSANPNLASGTANRTIKWSSQGPDFLGDTTSGATQDFFTCDDPLVTTGMFSAFTRATLRTYQTTVNSPDWNQNTVWDSRGTVLSTELHGIGVIGHKATAYFNWTGDIAAGNRSFLQDTADFPLGVPRSFGCTYDQGTFALWEHGVLITSAARSYAAQNTTQTAIGRFRRDAVRGLWNGTIEYVYVWNRALTPNEVAWLAAEPYCMIAPPVPDHVWWFTANLYTLHFSDTVTFSDSLKKSTGKKMTDSITFTDSLKRTVGKRFADSVTFSDSLAKTVGKKLADAVTFSDSLKKWTSKTFADAVTFTDSLRKNAGKRFADTFTLSDALTKSVGKVFSDTVTFADALTKAVSKTFTDAITFADSLNLSIGGILTLVRRAMFWRSGSRGSRKD